MSKITIIGAGSVGATIAYTMVVNGTASEIVMIDINGEKSLGEALDMLEGWLYGGDPADGLLVEDQLNALAARLDTDYFVDLIRELLLDDSHSVTVVRHRPIRWERRRRRRKLPVSPPRVPHGRRSSRRSWRSRRSPWLCGSRRRIVERPWPPSLCCRSLT